MIKFILPLIAMISSIRAVTLDGQLLKLKIPTRNGGSKTVGEVSQSKIFLNYGEKVSYPDKKGKFQM
jgi:hypothetical protein